MPLQISTEIRTDGEAPEIHVMCPICGNIGCCYTLLSERCNKCEYLLGNLYNINNNLYKRLKFHMEGIRAL